MKVQYPKTDPVASELIGLLRMEKKNIKKIKKKVNHLDKILSSNFNQNKHRSDEKCSKIDIFLNYLMDLKSKNFNIFLYLIPKEIQIKDYNKNKNDLCTEAEKRGLHCKDLVSLYVEHYSEPDNNSLFIDGVHLTVEGNKKMANWISKYKP